MVAGDMKCHIGSMRDGFSFGVRNQEGETYWDCVEDNLRVMNSYYRKRLELPITYRSGGNESQIEYVLCRRHKELKMKNFKGISGEGCVTQHRLLWAEVVIKGRKKRVCNWGEKKLKAWKLKFKCC